MCRLPPRLLYNRSRTEQEGVFYPSWSLVCAGKAHISSNRAYFQYSSLSYYMHSVGKTHLYCVCVPTYRECVV